jgi:large subunit ribosomal protein L33
MAKRSGTHPIITLACSDCRERNYTTVKNQRSDPQRMELSKYCPRCRHHMVHREVR